MDKISTGDYSTGNYSTGYYSTVYHSTGNYSTGYYSTGSYSTSNYSTGNYSTGYHSTGNRSTGNYSTGNRSTGHYSTGNRSTGSWSISDYSTGHFSTIDYSGFGAFNKPCTLNEWKNAKKPNFLYFDLTEWVTKEKMSDKEKADNPSYKTTGGYLKVYDYKKAFQKAYNKASDEDKALLLKLPNFDAEVFKEISGIDVNAKKTKTIVFDGKKIEISEESFDAFREQFLKEF